MKSSWQVDKIPIFTDNFVFIIHNKMDAIVIDPGEAQPVLEYLQKNNLRPRVILLTHHHWDHVDGVAEISDQMDVPVCAPLKNQKQLEGLATDFVHEGDHIRIEDLQLDVWEVPGHTLGHLAFWVPEQKWLFSGDVLFALGCGRLFEGSYEQMFQSLHRVKSLPAETTVFCTHDYYPTNQKFCEKNQIRTSGYNPSHPLSLAQEKLFNPFLLAEDLQSFQILREKRNAF